MHLLNLMFSVVCATLGWTGAPTVELEDTVTSNCAYVDSGPVSQCEDTVDDWRSFRALQDERILDGTFTLPGLLKITAVNVPAKPKRKGINPFTKEEQWFAAKPASTKVKVRPLKKLKDAAA